MSNGIRLWELREHYTYEEACDELEVIMTNNENQRRENEYQKRQMKNGRDR